MHDVSNVKCLYRADYHNFEGMHLQMHGGEFEWYRNMGREVVKWQPKL